MKVAFITRSTLDTAPGGDTIQIKQTAKQLRSLGAEVDILPTTLKIDYGQYDLLHFFNIVRPADILYHITKSKKPFVLSPIFIDYSEYDRHHRKGISGFTFRRFSPAANEYLKTIGRRLFGKDSLRSKNFLFKGQMRSIKEVIGKASWLLPNSEAEYTALVKEYKINKPYTVVPNGIDPLLFQPGQTVTRSEKLVICAARIEGIKNQLNLVKALNNTEFTLLLIGSAATNQKNYYKQCRQIASDNIQFIDHIPQEELLAYYKKAKVHVLPSWFESCGLSSLEAAAMGCNIVITDKGYTRDYFGNHAFYCDPANPASILDAVRKATQSEWKPELQEKIFRDFTWQQAAAATFNVYKKVLQS
ncbi:MAG TPA: glycosyltransferase family 4 protein [Chitinophagaceae bacterium]|nr:glycosyltransferase family 4 protein [Chitinophagaceae bacterium]